MRVVFIGPPGAGKGTQSQRLIGLLDIPHISSGELIREAMRTGTSEGLAAERYMQTGDLVPDPLIIGMLDRRLGEPDCRRGFLLDGFPRTVPQAESLDRDLAERRTPLDVVLELKVDEDALVRRMAGRGRVDDDPVVIRQRLRTFAVRTAPLSDYYHARNIGDNRRHGFARRRLRADPRRARRTLRTGTDLTFPRGAIRFTHTATTRRFRYFSIRPPPCVAPNNEPGAFPA
ncbi:MAG: adenylate kinase [Pirellulales bacterium]